MLEPQGSGMKHYAWDFYTPDHFNLPPTIGLIAKNGVAERRKMNPQLMGPSCTWIQQNMGCCLSVPVIDAVFSDRLSRPGGSCREDFPFFAITADRQFYDPMTFLWHAINDRLIYSVNRMVFELGS